MNLSPRPSTSRGFKGLFWRSRFNPSEISEVATAEPAKLQRNTLGDPLRSKAALPLKDGQLQEEQDVNSQKEYAGNRRETRSRPALADSACPNCRFIPSLPPAIQKGEMVDGSPLYSTVARCPHRPYPPLPRTTHTQGRAPQPMISKRSIERKATSIRSRFSSVRFASERRVYQPQGDRRRNASLSIRLYLIKARS